MLGPTVMRTEGRHHVGQLLLRPHPRCAPMGFTVMRGLHQNPFWCSAHVGHHRRPLVSCEGAGVGVVGSGVPSGSSAAAVASSFTSSEARGRRWGATAPAASSTTHWSPKDPLKLMHELTETTGTDVARKGRTGIERNIGTVVPRPHLLWAGQHYYQPLHLDRGLRRRRPGRPLLGRQELMG